MSAARASVARLRARHKHVVKTAAGVPRLISAMALVLVLTRWPSPAPWRRPRLDGKSPTPDTIDHGSERRTRGVDDARRGDVEAGTGHAGGGDGAAAGPGSGQ